MRPLTVFFAGREAARRLFAAVAAAVAAAGPAAMRVTRAKIAFRRRSAFAWAWTPDRWLRGETAPRVLSIALSRRDRSPRWKQVVQPSPGRLLREAWQEASS